MTKKEKIEVIEMVCGELTRCFVTLRGQEKALSEFDDSRIAWKLTDESRARHKMWADFYNGPIWNVEATRQILIDHVLNDPELEEG